MERLGDSGNDSYPASCVVLRNSLHNVPHRFNHQLFTGSVPSSGGVKRNKIWSLQTVWGNTPHMCTGHSENLGKGSRSDLIAGKCVLGKVFPRIQCSNWVLRDWELARWGKKGMRRKRKEFPKREQAQRQHATSWEIYRLVELHAGAESSKNFLAQN